MSVGPSRWSMEKGHLSWSNLFYLKNSTCLIFILNNIKWNITMILFDNIKILLLKTWKYEKKFLICNYLIKYIITNIINYYNLEAINFLKFKNLKLK